MSAIAAAVRTSIEGLTPIGSALVFLNLLEGEAQGLGQVVPADPQVAALNPDPGCDSDIDGVGTRGPIQGRVRYGNVRLNHRRGPRGPQCILAPFGMGRAFEAAREDGARR